MSKVWLGCSAVDLSSYQSLQDNVDCQGGIHPEFTGETYLEILKAVKKAVPDIHVHAFSPLEVFQGASTLGIRYFCAYQVLHGFIFCSR